MSRKKVLIQFPRLKVSGDKRTAYVEMGVRNPTTDKLVLKRIYKPFQDLKERNAALLEARRQAVAEPIIKEYTDKLKSGWKTWESEEFVYVDEISGSEEARLYGRMRKSNNTVRRYFSEFIEWKRPQVRPKTIASYTSKVRIFCKYLEVRGMEQQDVGAIGEQTISDFFTWIVEKEKIERITLEKYAQNIHGLFVFFRDVKKLIKDIPAIRVPAMPPGEDQSARPIAASDLKILLEYIRKTDFQLYVACMMQYYTAVRPGAEMRMLQIKHINMHAGTITIDRGSAKNKTTRIINIPVQFKEILRAYNIESHTRNSYVFSKTGMPGAEPVAVNAMYRRFVSARDVLGMNKEYVFYSMKHTGAGKMLENGFTIVEIQQHLGHKDITSTMHYIRRHFGDINIKVRDNFPDPF